MFLNLVLVLIFCHYGQTYKAAVFEYYPKEGLNPQEILSKNLEEYKNWVVHAKNQSADIAVFPEYGLTTINADPEKYAIEVTTNNEIVKQLSNISIENDIFLVVNILEKESNPTKYYNTDLVFNRSGDIVLQYRKINLCNEPQLTPGSINQQNTFQTPFGYFGIFTGCDILHKNSSRTLLADKRVTNIIFPTSMISNTPFQLSLSLQHGYVLENGVNLLAAGYGTPKTGRGGSGIYLADGSIAEAYLSDSPSSKPLVKEVKNVDSRQEQDTCNKIIPFALPDDEERSNVTDFNTGIAFSAAKYQFGDVDLTKNSSSTTVCHKKFCCIVEVVVQNVSSYDFYKVVAFDGYENSNDRVRICSLVACQTSSRDLCGVRTNTTTTFTKITLRNNFPRDDSSFYTVVTGNTFLLPFAGVNYCNTNNATNSTFIELTTLRRQKNVLVFGIYGRTQAPFDENYDIDDNNDGGNNSAVETFRTELFYLTVFALILIFPIIN